MTPAVSTGPTPLAQLSASATLPVGSRVAVRLAYLLLIWSERRRSRQRLRDLPPHLLRDIGHTPGQAHAESRKPFWRP
ncbi:DUF1127 domain-containing protein [Actibacterium sp. MT2.3-13A]|uniref:DUF1127 domain-containing protein n=1 Tax=Actibacterium sp. MT2.3-13A TaxID=2828332 RepID=UPI001BAA4741|nr:DUF1127 domain-containing protein [Actibacterium sp. MT2.3-13A]